MISFCTSYRLVIKNTFNHKCIHNATWRALGSRYANEIDCVCISFHWPSAISYVSVPRGAGSDPHLLLGNCTLCLKRLPSRQKRPRPFNVRCLHNARIKSKSNYEITFSSLPRKPQVKIWMCSGMNSRKPSPTPQTQRCAGDLAASRNAESQITPGILLTSVKLIQDLMTLDPNVPKGTHERAKKTCPTDQTQLPLQQSVNRWNQKI